MISLLILGLLLVACWLWATWQRDAHAAFMRDWVHVPLVTGAMCLVMAIGLWIR